MVERLKLDTSLYSEAGRKLRDQYPLLFEAADREHSRAGELGVGTMATAVAFGLIRSSVKNLYEAEMVHTNAAEQQITFEQEA